MLAAAASFFTAQQRGMAVQEVYARSQNVTRTALDLMARELRMATYDPSGAALPLSPGPSCPGVRQGLVSATRTHVQFQQDLNGDGDLTDGSEDVTYDFAGDALTRRDGTSTAIPLVEGIPATGFALRYYTGGYPPVELVPTPGAPGMQPALTAAQLPCVAKIQVALTAMLDSPDPRRSAKVTSRAETEVAIRNRSLANF
jgi:type IV pilus assembly protein PilW